MDDRSARIAKRLELPLLIAAVLTIPTTIVEESHLGHPWSQIATGVNWAIWLMFFRPSAETARPADANVHARSVR